MQGQNRVGQTLGNYRLMRLLGKGGYAEVYLAENVHLGVQAAIKVLKLRDLDTLEREKFRFEAKYMTTLEHPRIIKVLDYGIEMSQPGSGNDGSTPYLVMEYAPLGTLRHLYSRGTSMPLLKIVSYTKQVAEALQYAHDKGIIHRDVKPENMLVRKPDDVALSDFGIAVAGLNTDNLQMQKEEILAKMARGEQITVPGTAPYLAPERLQGHTQRASDQYSLAIVVYEWLCGSQPFEGSDLEVCQKHVSESPPSLCTSFAHISREVERVVMKALSKDPAHRYKSVREFALALESAVQVSSQPTTPKVAPLPPTVLPRPVLPSPTPQQIPPISPLPFSTPPISIPPTPIPSSSPASPLHLGGNQNQNQGPTSPFQGYSTSTVSIVPPQGPVAQSSDSLSAVFSAVFVSDAYFVKTQRTRRFLLLGIPLNVLSAIIVFISGPIPSSLIPAILGGVISVLMVWRCATSVKKPIAIAFGAGVALWWGYVVANVAAHLNDTVITGLCFFIAFIVSLGIHYWHIDNRLKN